MHKKPSKNCIDLIQNLKANAKELWFFTKTPTAKPSTVIEFESIAHGDSGIVNKWLEQYHITYRCRNLKFIHIGKCGGTSIIHHFFASGVALQEYHLVRPYINPTDWYFLWIRNPLDRFVSAFNHAKTIINFDISAYDPQKLTLDNCPAPQKILNRIKHGFAFDPVYDHLVNSFSSANELAESLSNSNKKQKARAYDLMTHNQEHIFKGIGWYLRNGLFVKKCFRQFLFVGRIENFDADFRRFLDLASFPDWFQGVPEIKRKNKEILSRSLSDRAIKDLRKFYSGSDYKALAALAKYRLLDKDVLEEYNYYP